MSSSLVSFGVAAGNGSGWDLVTGQLERQQAAGVERVGESKTRSRWVAHEMSVGERYLQFLKTYAAISIQVPQRMLASYFGVSPETLSRVRKHLSQK